MTRDFGFRFPPFGVTPDQRFVYQHRQFREALDALKYGIAEGKGFIVITGEIGAGKTTMLRAYLRDAPENLSTAVVLNTGLGPDELLRAIIEDLGIEVERDADRKRLMDSLHEHLFETFESGRLTAVFIDEAQNLSTEALEVLRMVSNIETETAKLIQIVLFGQDPLREILSRPEMAQLKQRVAVHYHLKPLGFSEVEKYVVHRLTIAAPTEPVVFSGRALRLLNKASRGIPRMINILADRTLAIAAEDDTGRIEPVHLKAAMKTYADLRPPLPTDKGILTGRRATLAAYLVLLLVVLFVAGRWWNGRMDRVDGVRIEETAPPETSATPSPGPIEGYGQAVEALFAVWDIDPGYPPELIERMRRGPLAAELGMAWFDLPADPGTIGGIGLPAIIWMDTRDGEIPVMVHPDTAGVVMPGGEFVPWELIALAENKAGLIAPPEAWDGEYHYIGEVSPRILMIQEILVRLGMMETEPNGRYGPATTEAVRRFQEEKGLTVDGITGPWTSLALWNAARSAGLEDPFGPADQTP